MKLLAIDTATQACSAALLVGDAIAEDYAEVPRQHNRLILPMVQRLLDEAGLGLGELDALAFGRGPGAFTGVRLAAGVVQGLALGAGLPVVPVSNLAALAQGGLREWGWRRIVACLDARIGELYPGKPVDTFPDLIIDWDQGSSSLRIASPRFGRLERVPATPRTGDHEPDGLLVARGPGIGANLEIGAVESIDLAATISALMGVANSDLEGRPIEAFCPAP